MQTGKSMKKSFLLLVTLTLSSSHLVGFESQVERPVRDTSTLAERVRNLGGNDGSWRVPDSAGERATVADRQGLQDNPLSIFSVSGARLGDVFQLRSAERYVGLLVVTNEKGQAEGLSSGFSEAQWPLDRVSREFALKDLNNALFEPQFYLLLDEDRLLLRVNLGKKELELDEVYLSAGEIRRGKGRNRERATQR